MVVSPSPRAASPWVLRLALVIWGLTLVLALLPWVQKRTFTPKPAPATPSPATPGSATDPALLQQQAQSYQLWLQNDPNNPAAIAGLLKIKLAQKDLGAVVPLLSQVAAQHPDQPDYQILLAQTQQYLQDYEGAAIAYRQLLAEQPYEMKALQGLVHLYLQQQQPERAIGILQEAIRKSATFVPKNAQASPPDVVGMQLLLAEVFLVQKKTVEAMAIFEQASELDRKDFRPVLGKALLLRQQQKYATAQPYFEQALALSPPDYRDHLSRLITQNRKHLTTSSRS